MVDVSELDQRIQEARAQLDAHAVEIVKWHFSPETGCPFWLDWAKEANWNGASRSSPAYSRILPGLVVAIRSLGLVT